MPRSPVRRSGPRVAWYAAIGLVATTVLVGCAGVPNATPSTIVGPASAAPSHPGFAPSPGVTMDDFSTTCRPGPWPPGPTDVPGAAATLVPFAPTRALLCLYALDPTLTGSQPYRLVASRDVTTAALADEIRTRLNSAATGPPADQMLCPKDSGTTLDIYFRDSNQQIELEIGTSGCRAVTNGTYDARIAAAVPYLASIVPFPPGVE